MMTAKMTINGKTYEGNNISIINGVVFIDGVKQEPIDGITARDLKGQDDEN